MNDEPKDEGLRGKKMLTGKRLVLAILGAVLAGAVIAGIYYYENTYKFRQYSIDSHTDLGKTATKIALDTAISEGYEPSGLIPIAIKAQNLGDYMRLRVILPGNKSYNNITLITNHPIKNGETSIFLEDFVQPVESSQKEPWTPGSATWPPKYYTITMQNSTIEASFRGGIRARIINPVIVEMNEEQNKKQIDKFNDLANSLGGTNISYDANILVISTTYSDPKPDVTTMYNSIEVVMDIEDLNAKIIGISKYENIFEPKDGYSISKTIQENKVYREPVVIKSEN